MEDIGVKELQGKGEQSERKRKQANTRRRGAAGFMKPCMHLSRLDADWSQTKAKTASLGLSCLGYADRRAAEILAYFACFSV